MDFGFTEEQENFRREIGPWLDANIPADRDLPADLFEMDEETHSKAVKLRSQLAEKGWLRPTYPKKYGGGELSYDQLEVFSHELAKRRMPEVYDASYLAGSVLLRMGTEKQKQNWLPLICQGKIICWQCYTEPEAGTDLANVRTRASRQPDGSYILDGQKIYSGNGRPVDYLITLAVTDPKAPRHRNLSLFIIKADSPGISMEFLDPICMHRKRVIHFDSVSVPAENLLGPENQGWDAAQVSLAGERGRTYILEPYVLLEEFIGYCKQTKRDGKRLVDDPRNRERLVELMIEARSARTLFWRTMWKGGHGIPTTYEGFQNNLQYKEFLPMFAQFALEIAGPAAILNDPRLGVLGDRMEYFQRMALMTHGAGTPEALKISFARAIGVGARKDAKS